MRGVHRGHAEARKWFEEAILEPWDTLHMELEEMTESDGDRVFAESLVTARGKASGVETELRVWQVFWFAHGKVARRQVFWSRQEALDAAGLSK